MPRDVLVRFRLHEGLVGDNDTARRIVDIWLDNAVGAVGYPISHLEQLPDIVAVVGPEFPADTILPCPV